MRDSPASQCRIAAKGSAGGSSVGEVDFALLVNQLIVDSWNEVVYPVLALVPVGWNQALNVCQWVHEHIAESVSGISAANRFTDCAAVPPLPPLVRTDFVDNFVGLPQQESVARDAAERISSALACLAFSEGDPRPVGGVSPWALAPSWRCFMSRRWVGVSEDGRCGERSRLPSVRLGHSLVGAVRDGPHGCPSSVNFGWQRARSFWLIGTCWRRGVRGIIVRCLSIGWCGCR